MAGVDRAGVERTEGRGRAARAPKGQYLGPTYQNAIIDGLTPQREGAFAQGLVQKKENRKK